MPRDESTDRSSAFVTAAARPTVESYVLRLYVADDKPRSSSVIERVRRICQRRLDDTHTLEVFNLAARPELARQAGVLATPALVKEQPAPRRKIAGYMQDEARLLAALDLTAD